MMWRAPEFKNEFVFFTMAKEPPADPRLPEDPGRRRGDALDHRQDDHSPAALPFFFSPEVFTHNGRSYIFAEVSSSAAFFDRRCRTSWRSAASIRCARTRGF